MTCDDVRPRLLDYQRGRLPAPVERDVRAHLAGCGDCTRADAAERELTSVLEQRLPQHPASLALKRRLATQWSAPPARRSRWTRWRPALVPVFVAALVLLVAVPVLLVDRAASRRAADAAGTVTEAVNDHLRLLASARPLDVESGGLHTVKPWFAGRVDFAPVVEFEGDADFPLKGGAVTYVRDRKAAAFVYGRRLHTITLLVVRAEGLAWPGAEGRVHVTAERGFNVILWRRGELGYALVSDVDARELGQLAARLGGNV